MDFGIIGLWEKFEQRFGRTPANVLLLLLYLLVVSGLIHIIVRSWVEVSGFINQGGRPGIAAAFGVMVFYVVMGWLAFKSLWKRELERFKEELILCRDNPDLELDDVQKKRNERHRMSIRDICILVGVCVCIAVAMVLVENLLKFLVKTALTTFDGLGW